MIKEVAILANLRGPGEQYQNIHQIALTQEEIDKVLVFISELHGGQIKLHEEQSRGFFIGAYMLGWSDLGRIIRATNESFAQDARNAVAILNRAGEEVPDELRAMQNKEQQ